MSLGRHDKHEDFPLDMYIAYGRAIGLGIERRVMDSPPRRPAEFWRMCQSEIDYARWRMRHVSGEIRKLSAPKS